MKNLKWLPWLVCMGFSAVQAEPQAKMQKLNSNHNSYTYHNYRKVAPRTTPAAVNYSEVEVVAPRLEAVTPVPSAPAPARTAPTLVQPEVTSYTQTHTTGPTLASNRAASFSSGIYATGPIFGPFGPYGYNPYGFNGGLYNPYGYANGYNNGFNGFYQNTYFNPGCGQSGIRTNLTPQRFDPSPGQHPYSIQAPAYR